MGSVEEALASAAGRALVSAMASGVWYALRDTMAELLGRRDRARVTQVTKSLEASREAVATGAASRETVATRWQGRLEALIEEDPDAAVALRSIIDRTGGDIAFQPVSERESYTSGRTQVLQHNYGGATIVA
ncbi:hypothetical protein [Streptomyces sp. NPDC047042]|uniref:hypothetical protein n=1 Tax=Streptomyces sp. NPDC047042 TaxID=3154807 RepID=UPI0033D9F46C